MACQAGSRCDKLALRVAHSKLRMGWRKGLWSSDSVITEMSVRGEEGRREPEGGGKGKGKKREREKEERGQDIRQAIFCLAFSIQLPLNGRAARDVNSGHINLCDVYFKQVLGIHYCEPHTPETHIFKPKERR